MELSNDHTLIMGAVILGFLMSKPTTRKVIAWTCATFEHIAIKQTFVVARQFSLDWVSDLASCYVEWRCKPWKKARAKQLFKPAMETLETVVDKQTEAAREFSSDRRVLLDVVRPELQILERELREIGVPTFSRVDILGFSTRFDVNTYDGCQAFLQLYSDYLGAIVPDLKIGYVDGARSAAAAQISRFEDSWEARAWRSSQMIPVLNPDRKPHQPTFRN